MSTAQETTEVQLHRQTAVPAAVHRLSLAAAMAVGSSYYLGLLFGACYFAAILTYEVLFLKFGDAFVLKHAVTDPARFQRNAMIVIVGAACLYALGWVPACFLGPPGAVFFAALSIAGLVVHNVLYLSEPRFFTASVAPHALVAVVVPFVRFPTFEAPVLAISVVVLIATAGVALLERMKLLQVFVEKEAERQQAQAASGAKSDFLATMSHELRTPLNAVIGYSEILEEDLVDKGEVASAADAARISRSARSLLGLINEVLDFSKIEAGRMELVTESTNVPEILHAVVETTQHIATANNTVIALEIDADVADVEIDGGRFRQCVLNLVSNACKFTTDGRVTVSAGRQPNGQLQVRVADSGVGIAAEQVQRLFQPFVQVDGSKTRNHHGTGLGLAITRRLAQLMGGDVTCESVAGVGSTFTLTVMVDAPRADVGEGPLVLVVDDNPDHRRLVHRLVEGLPLRVQSVGTAAAALAAATGGGRPLWC
jgi:signal transduction histidine kinase